MGRLRRGIAWRGLQIWLLGYALHLAFYFLGGSYGPLTRVLKVDILHCIGVGMILTAAIAWPSRRRNWSALALYFALLIFSQVTARLPLESVVPVGLAAYLSPAVPGSLFSPVPYASWIALGLFVGPLWAPTVGHGPAERRFFIVLVAVAVITFAMGRVVKVGYYDLGLPEAFGLPGPKRGLIHMFLYKAGVLLLIFSLSRLAALFLDRLPGKAGMGPLVLLGRTSLFAYAVHLFLIYHLGGRPLLGTLGPEGHLLGFAALCGVMLVLVFLWSNLRGLIRNIRKQIKNTHAPSRA